MFDLLAVEEHARQAAQTFKQVLDAASQFGGSEVVEFQIWWSGTPV